MADDPKRRGRPSLDDTGVRSTQIGLRLPTKDFDVLCKRAQQDGLTVAEVIRRDLRRAQPADEFRYQK